MGATRTSKDVNGLCETTTNCVGKLILLCYACGYHLAPLICRLEGGGARSIEASGLVYFSIEI